MKEVRAKVTELEPYEEIQALQDRYSAGDIGVQDFHAALQDPPHRWRPLRYGNLWDLGETNGPSRLVIAPYSRHIEVLLDLAADWRENYYLLYVLTVSRVGANETGRYQSPGPFCGSDPLSAAICSSMTRTI